MKLTNEIVIDKAKEFGFDLIGFAKADLLIDETKRLKFWLNEKYNASMEYLERNFEKRLDVKNILSKAASVISLGINYYPDENFSAKNGTGKISRYAWGKDYHLIIWNKLNEIISFVKNIKPDFEAKSFVDTGPVMDKAWAVRAGIGWQGKNSNIISKNFGSWFFVANIITNINFDYSVPVKNYCGSCSACIDACPTKAIVSDFVVDSNKCISFLTIENKNEIPKDFKNKFDGWIFGCDICQEICPWNKKFSTQTKEDEFYSSYRNKEILLKDILEMSENEFKMIFKDSPIKRAKLSELKRNAQFLIS